MLSAQCGELRDRAQELRMLSGGMGAPLIVPETKKAIGLAMNTAASRMELAADTIWHLRNAEAENAQMRELVRDAYALLKLSAGIPATLPDVEAAEDTMRRLGIEVGE